MQVKSDRLSEIQNLESLAKLMDSQFKIPGTNIRFGLDSVMGLIPGAGDFAGFLVAGYIVIILAKNGASGFLLARMTFNILADAILGSIPFVGDLFDIGFKANQRNIKLMREHYVEGRHQGSALKLIIPLILVLLTGLATILWLSYKALAWLFQ